MQRVPQVYSKGAAIRCWTEVGPVIGAYVTISNVSFGEIAMSDEMTVNGYKATDKDIKCRDYQFIPGEWHEYDGEIKLCESGFHFCEQPSGPWCYYTNTGTRIWKVEAQGVLDIPREPGADFKLVCKKIRLVEEVLIGGDSNTGNRNTGNRNTGDSNTGHRNTGHRNTGNSNTGYRNTGDSNTGDSNTGESNIGNRNTGHSNTGNRNTGNRNTGDSNTGDWNTTNHSAGFFCQQEPSVICFDVDTGLSRSEFDNKYGSISAHLGRLFVGDEPIDFDQFSSLPGVTPEKLLSLHQKFINARLS
jgi:hypothetical protein